SLGPALEQLRRRPSAFDQSPFRTFGTYGVWFPRGLLLRAAAQKIALRLLKVWRNDAPPVDPTPITELVTQVTADERLKPDAIQRTSEAVGNEFSAAVRPLEVLPGHRIGAVESAFRKLAHWCSEAGAFADRKTDQIGVKVGQARTDVQSALDVCQAGSGTFSF